MDFGDILKQWEAQQKTLKKRGASAGSNNRASQQTRQKNSHGKNDASTQTTKNAAAASAQKSDVEKRINPEELWLRRYGTFDKDALAEREAERERERSFTYLKEIPVAATIDLHGLTREEAWLRLDNFVGGCVKKGLRKILIVHGKGIHTTGSDPVLGDVVQKFIETDKRCGRSGHPKGRDGGSGATWVLLKW